MHERRTSSRSRRALALATLLTLAALPLAASEKGSEGAEYGRNYDLRVVAERGSVRAPSAAQLAAVARLAAEVPGVRAEYHPETGATRKLANASGFVTRADRSHDPVQVALAFVAAEVDLLGLAPGDLEDYEVTDEVYSATSGVTHLYLRQRSGGIPVYNGQLHVNVASDGRILLLNNQFVPGLASAANATAPALTAADAVVAAGRHLGAAAPAAPRVVATYPGAQQVTRLIADQLSLEPVEARLMYLPAGADARLVWNFQLWTLDHDHVFDFTVDAVDGRVWTRYDWVADATYKVYPPPIESPLNATPAPPGDGRVIETDPWDLTASPWGWHDTNGAPGAEFTITRGNNVHAWEDSDGNNTEPGSPAGETECGASISCEFPIDLTQHPSTYRPAAVANLFYWNNIIHDTQYLYGFDEVAGNFQVNNYGNGGAGNDHVRALAQSGAGTCNANFLTPADGSPGRMRMYICANVSPTRDGDLDNLVIVHEYGHGISNRLVGGPSNVSCLGNQQQGGEGYSDWWGLVYTHEPGDQGTDVRPVGLYLIGSGIRPQPYSTDPTVNTYTYETIGSVAVPHGVGSVWAQAAWEVYWRLVDDHGFEPDIWNSTSGAGNIRALHYVSQGLKNAACSPTFLDVRDGIIAAAASLNGGEDVCRIWEAFAAFGLGEDASTPGPNSTSATNGFALPLICSFGTAGDDARVCAGTSHVQDVLVGPAFTSPPVDMSAVGHPAGTTAGFSENPVAGPLPKTIQLTIGNTAVAGAGTYTIDVTADDGVSNYTDSFALTVDVGTPAAPALVSPPDGDVGTARKPLLTWSPVATAASYSVEIATDAGFTNIVASASGLAAASYAVTTNLAVGTLHYWRVVSENACGTSAASAVFEFTTGIPSVLLVDDDDNAPNVQDRYQTTLNSLVVYDVWDVVAQGGEPTFADMSGYKTVVWFSGDRFTGSTSPSAGPQAASQTALSLYLQNGRCFFLSSQDYAWDMLGSGTQAANAFMAEYLGFSQVASDSGDYTRVDGENVYSAFQDLTLTYSGLFSDFSDELTLGSGQTAFRGDLPAGNTKLGATSKLGSTYFSTFLAFGLEAMSEVNRAAVLQHFFDTCQAEVPLFADGFESGNSCAWSTGAAAACP